MNRRRSGSLTTVIVLLALVAIIFFAVKGYISFLKSPPAPKGTAATIQAFVIKKGESIDSISDRLEKAGLVRSRLIFKWELKNSGKASNIQAGDFKLSPAMSVIEIIKNFSEGAVDRWVTLLEGWRVEEMAAKLNSELGIKNEEFIEAAKDEEGYLFPDTYLFNPEATVNTIISTLQATFDNKYDESLQAKVKKNGLTPEEGVILASIVEREARSDEVRTKVASILLKRFKNGMGLDADATIQYALGYQPTEKSWWKRHLTKEDLQIISPFNTYRHAGLPPTPICNPSLSSLKAVANADSSTPYLYYFHDSKGNSYYAKTLEEHNKNVVEHR